MRSLLLLFLLTLQLHSTELPAERIETLQLQIYLDQNNFSPGVLDGKMGTYTRKAIAAYNKKFGFDEDDIDSVKQKAHQSVPNIFATAIVPNFAHDYIDTNFRHGDNRSYQASRKDMPYRSIAEFMAERYQTSLGLLQLLNTPEAVARATTHSALLVPNVSAFQIENLAEGRTHKQDDILSRRWAVIDTKAHQIRIYEPLEPNTLTPEAAEDIPTPAPLLNIGENIDLGSTARATIVEEDPAPAQQLSAHDEHRALLVAAYPITPGKPEFIRYGTWKMLNAIELPTWRYDASLLKTGKRSNQSLQIPSGPNNPVGVIWMGLSRPGIGIHGTDNPEKIGRGRSSGCIRLANWNAVKLPTMIRPGATVIIK